MAGQASPLGDTSAQSVLLGEAVKSRESKVRE
jgi:hypothetical protein